MNDSNSGTTLLRIPEVAKRLAVSRRTISRMLSQGVLPAVTVGTRGTRIADAAIEAYIRELRYLKQPPIKQPLKQRKAGVGTCAQTAIEAKIVGVSALAVR